MQPVPGASAGQLRATPPCCHQRQLRCLGLLSNGRWQRVPHEAATYSPRALTPAPACKTPTERPKGPDALRISHRHPTSERSTASDPVPPDPAVFTRRLSTPHSAGDPQSGRALPQTKTQTPGNRVICIYSLKTPQISLFLQYKRNRKCLLTNQVTTSRTTI